MSTLISRFATQVPVERSRNGSASWRQLDPERAEFRDAYLRDFPSCAARGREHRCEGIRNVCHVGPVHLYPELLLHRGNVLTLCELAHFLIQHGGDNWAWVPAVRVLVAALREGRMTWREAVARARRERIYHRLPVRFQTDGSRPVQPSTLRAGRFLCPPSGANPARNVGSWSAGSAALVVPDVTKPSLWQRVRGFFYLRRTPVLR